MRQAIRAILISAVPEVQGRVFQRGGATLTTPKPFLVVATGAPDPEASWSPQSTALEIWIYGPQTDAGILDTIEAKVQTALSGPTGTGRRFDEGGGAVPVVRYLSVPQPGGVEDFEDPDWKALVRTARFRVFRLGWYSSQTFSPDPVLALREWTEARWPSLQTDPEAWNPADETPAVYWRLSGATEFERLNWGTWITGAVRGHVIAPDGTVQDEWGRRVYEGISLTKRIRMADGSDAEVLPPATWDGETDPMRTGQLRLTVRWGVLDPDFDSDGTGFPINSVTLDVSTPPVTQERRARSVAVLA